MPSRTASAMPPILLAMTGRRWRKASWITSGAFSHQIEGTTTQSTARDQVRRSRRGDRGQDERRADRLPSTEGVELVDEILRLERRAAVEPQLEILDALRNRRCAALRRLGDALPGIEIAEIAEDRAASVRRGRCGAGSAAGRPLATTSIAVGRQAPSHIALLDEPAWRDEEIDLPEKGLEDALAQQELVGGDIGEAAVAAIGHARSQRSRPFVRIINPSWAQMA